MCIRDSYIAKHFEEGHYEHGPADSYKTDTFAYANRVKMDMYKRYGVLGAAGDRHLAESKDTWNEIKLVGIKEYFHKQYPGLEIHYDVVMSDNLLKGLEQYIKDNQIDIIALTSYKRNIFARLFNPSIARKMIFHSDTPLLVMNG